MNKTISLIAIITVLLSAGVFLSSAQAAEKTLFTPCQYKNSYKYYMERGDAYYADNQFESAIESYKRALIVQPNSKEAVLKIKRAKARLAGKTESSLMSAREKAVARAIRFTEYRQGRAKKPAVAKKSAKTESDPRHTPEKASGRRVIARRYDGNGYGTGDAYAAEPGPDTVVSVKKPTASEPAEKPGRLYAQEYPSATPKEKAGALPESYGYSSMTGLGGFYSHFDLNKFSNGVNDKIQQASDSINEGIAPSHMSGEYRLAFGAKEDDFLWKDSNADYHNMPGDVSWRYLYGKDKFNTYDKKIYSRLKVDVDGVFTDTLSGFGQLVIDPWTFVGKKRVYVTGSGGDSFQLDYKYWSNARSTINETYRSDKGDIINVNENKVIKGKTSTASYSGLTDWGGGNKFDVPEVEIDRMYVPIRKLWLNYNKGPYKAKAFAMAGQEEALTSDDPMRLSNNKVWWEEGPWLDTYQPSKTYQRAGTSAPDSYTGLREPLGKGQWVRNLSFEAKDSDDQFLTFLRGGSFEANFSNGVSFHMVGATPRNLWDRYDQATSLPGAIRVKAPVTDKLNIGGLYTLKTGFRHNSVEALNNLGAIDGAYEIFDGTSLFAEFAATNMNVEESNGYDNEYTGYAGKAGIRSEGPITFISGEGNKYKAEAGFASMNENFFPGLSNYRYTRKEFEFAKHIFFDEMDPRNEEIMFGDGMDIGRNAFHLTAKAEFPDNNIDGRFDFRTVYSNGNDLIEDVYRLEATYKPFPKLTLKGLGFYKHLPETIAGIDPLMNVKNSYSAFTDYFAYVDEFLENSAVPGGKDPSIGAFSGGLEYDVTDYFTARGVYEATNDPKDFPRGLLNNAYVTDVFKDNVVWDKVVPFLYDQASFGIPAYGYYSIFKARFIYYPFDPLKVTLKYTYNQDKYAMATDDNATANGIELEYKPHERLTLGFLYQYTRQRDIYKQFVANQGLNYDGHHNIFAALDYQLNEDQHLRVSYGEYIGYDYIYAENHDALTALDTRHIVRVAYTGTWGGPDKREPLNSLRTGWTPLGNLKPGIPGAKFTTKLSGGWAKYTTEANSAPVESDWDNYLGRLEFGLEAFDKESWEGSLKLGLFTTLETEEKWDYSGVGTYQTDDMYFGGADVNANIGWALGAPSKYISFTPLVNAGYRRIEVSRSKIKTTSTTVSTLGEVDEHFNVSYAGIGARVDFGPFNERVNLYGSGFWAPLIYAPVKNDVTGYLTSEGGNIYHAEGGCDYSLSDRFELSLGGFWDVQELDSAERVDDSVVTAELPDSKFETFGITLGGLYKF